MISFAIERTDSRVNEFFESKKKTRLEWVLFQIKFCYDISTDFDRELSW